MMANDGPKAVVSSASHPSLTTLLLIPVSSTTVRKVVITDDVPHPACGLSAPADEDGTVEFLFSVFHCSQSAVGNGIQKKNNKGTVEEIRVWDWGGFEAQIHSKTRVFFTQCCFRNFFANLMR